MIQPLYRDYLSETVMALPSENFVSRASLETLTVANSIASSADKLSRSESNTNPKIAATSAAVAKPVASQLTVTEKSERKTTQTVQFQVQSAAEPAAKEPIAKRRGMQSTVEQSKPTENNSSIGLFKPETAREILKSQDAERQRRKHEGTLRSDLFQDNKQDTHATSELLERLRQHKIELLKRTRNSVN